MIVIAWLPKKSQNLHHTLYRYLATSKTAYWKLGLKVDKLNNY